MIINKNKLKKAGLIILYTLTAVGLAFMLYVVGAAFFDKNVNESDLQGKFYYSADLQNYVKFNENSVILKSGSKVSRMEISSIEHSIVIVKDGSEYFSIKFLSSEQIFCEKTKQYLFLAT